MSIPVSFDVQELVGSPTWSIGVEGTPRGERKFLCNWSDAGSLAGLLLGGGITTQTPAVFPHINGLFCATVSIEPFSGEEQPSTGGAITDLDANDTSYTKVVLTASYAVVSATNNDSPNAPPGTTLNISSSISAEMMTTPGRSWNWFGIAAVPDDDVPPAILIMADDIAMRWSRVPESLAPTNAIRELRGRVNNGTFMGYGAEQVLFSGAVIDRDFQFNTQNQPFVKIEYHFKAVAKPSTKTAGLNLGWNHFWSPEDLAGEHWLKLETQDVPPKNAYQTGNLDQLFVLV